MHPMAHNPEFPRAADTQAARHLREDFAGLGAAEQKFAESAAGQTLLDCLGGNAPYLPDLACREPACLLSTMADGPEKSFASVLGELQALPPDTPRREIAARLRQAKRRAALTIAIADLGGMWPLPQIPAALSELAETACRVAVRHLLFSLHEAGQIALPYLEEPERNSGFVALALGKLGARELNYSSDIDLVLLFDPDSPVYSTDAQP